MKRIKETTELKKGMKLERQGGYYPSETHIVLEVEEDQVLIVREETGNLETISLNSFTSGAYEDLQETVPEELRQELARIGNHYLSLIKAWLETDQKDLYWTAIEGVEALAKQKIDLAKEEA